jgi:hypothetical protein
MTTLIEQALREHQHEAALRLLADIVAEIEAYGSGVDWRSVWRRARAVLARGDVTIREEAGK